MNENFPPEVIKRILEAFNEAGSANINALQQVQDIQVVMGSLLQHEAKRLEKKMGKENLRVQQVQASLKRNQAIARDLVVELEIAKVRVPEVDTKDSLIHGRIVDENRRGLVKLRINLESEPGKTLSFLGSAETNASGYYALEINAKALVKLKELAPNGVFLIVCTSSGKRVYRKSDPLQLKGGDRILVEVVLKRGDLSPVGGGKQPDRPKDNQTPSQPEQRVVRGRVIDEQGRGIPRLKVSAIEENRRYDDKLGTALTNEKGEFSITYTLPAGQQSALNLYVTVIDAKSNPLYSSANEIRRNASREEVYEIKLKMSDRGRGDR
ncbi:MAG TPA: hypothetical protein DDZ80_10910 [Cyanobacteria bacterium UBA8803]|nr:hypothetical protein [Cyanobacteria bacterium UBA9273]HBL59002.1 hypothetical protein [Cyanobacteria bacterium UBA8803]